MVLLSRILFGRLQRIKNIRKNTINHQMQHDRQTSRCLRWFTDPLKLWNSNQCCSTHSTHEGPCVQAYIRLGQKPVMVNTDSIQTQSSQVSNHVADNHIGDTLRCQSVSDNNQFASDKIKAVVQSSANHNQVWSNHRLHSKSESVDNRHTSDIPSGRSQNPRLYGYSLLSHNIQRFSNYYTNDLEHPLSEFELSDYYSLRQHCAFYDKSHSTLIKIEGTNSDYYLNQLLTSRVSKISRNEVEYACLLDSKGVIIETCFVAKMKDYYLLITTGNKREEVFDYISSYAVHLRGFGMDLSIHQLDHRVGTLYGPESEQTMRELLSEESPEIRITESENPDKRGGSVELRAIMNSFNLKFRNHEEEVICYRVSDVEDGFEFIVPIKYYSDFFEFLLSNTKVRNIGDKAYDIARLERGIIRPDVDLTPESTPMHCSLMWNVDIEKIKKKEVFGHKNIGYNMVEEASKMRVGLICNEMVTPTCTILTKATRMPIGLITSSAYSPALGMYIAHCYVNRDYARNDMPVIISIPKEPEEKISKAMYKKYYRNKVLKKFIMGTVVRLPFIKGSYQVKASEKGYKENDSDYLREKRSEDRRSEVIIKNEEQNVKSKKQMWKEIIKNHKKKVKGTIEMAYRRWEMNKEESMCVEEETNNKDNEELWKRINLNPKEKMDTKDIVNYYQNRHQIEVSSRHGRYRPKNSSELNRNNQCVT